MISDGSGEDAAAVTSTAWTRCRHDMYIVSSYKITFCFIKTIDCIAHTTLNEIHITTSPNNNASRSSTTAIRRVYRPLDQAILW